MYFFFLIPLFVSNLRSTSIDELVVSYILAIGFIKLPYALLHGGIDGHRSNVFHLESLPWLVNAISWPHLSWFLILIIIGNSLLLLGWLRRKYRRQHSNRLHSVGLKVNHGEGRETHRRKWIWWSPNHCRSALDCQLRVLSARYNRHCKGYCSPIAANQFQPNHKFSYVLLPIWIKGADTAS
jgi:hypothetical protein